MSLAALAQRRHVDREDLQAVEQVLAHLAVLHRLVRVAVGGGDHPHVDVDRLVAADAHHGAGLQHAQELDLQLDRHLGDLVEEERAACGRARSTPCAAAAAPVKLPRSWPNSSLSISVGEMAPQLSGRKGALRPPRQQVERLRGELLAGAALADQEDRGVGRRHPVEHLVERLHRRRGAQQQAEAAHLLRLGRRGAASAPMGWTLRARWPGCSSAGRCRAAWSGSRWRRGAAPGRRSRRRRGRSSAPLRWRRRARGP